MSTFLIFLMPPHTSLNCFKRLSQSLHNSRPSHATACCYTIKQPFQASHSVGLHCDRPLCDRHSRTARPGRPHRTQVHILRSLGLRSGAGAGCRRGCGPRPGSWCRRVRESHAESSLAGSHAHPGSDIPRRGDSYEGWRLHTARQTTVKA